MASPYDILQIDPDADEAEIVRAYRRRVKETHPDLGGSAEELRLVKEAYETLVHGSDREARDRTSTPDRRHQDRPEGSTVEYIDYEVLVDRGWNLDDDDLFEKASPGDFDSSDRGRFIAEPDESLLEAAENHGYTWPYSCRGGACANCAVAVVDGELSMPVNHILPTEMTDRGVRLSCVGKPLTDDLKVVYNVKHLPTLDELRLPPLQYEGEHRAEGA